MLHTWELWFLTDYHWLVVIFAILLLICGYMFIVFDDGDDWLVP